MVLARAGSIWLTVPVIVEPRLAKIESVKTL